MNACIFYMIGRYQYGFERASFCDGPFNGTTTSEAAQKAACQWKDTWVGLQIGENLLNASGGSTFSRYLRSYWSLPTLVVVVIGDITPVTATETLYVVIVILFGLTINAIVIGSVIELLADLVSSHAQHRHKVDQLESVDHFEQDHRFRALQQECESFWTLNMHCTRAAIIMQYLQVCRRP